MDKGVLQGISSGLNVSEDVCRMLTILGQAPVNNYSLLM